MDYHWEQIKDYQKDPVSLAIPELTALAGLWNDQRSRLENLRAYATFERRLRREWAIETGLIEGLYTLDRGVTELLLERGFKAELISHEQSSNPEWLVATMGDHEAAVDGLFDFVKGNRMLSTSYIKELHALMTRHQKVVQGVDSLNRQTSVPLVRGVYKRLPNNPRRADGALHEYCPPEHVASEMDRLIALHCQHVSVPPEVEAAWLHHRFTQIHPFQDGNGRVARALASLVFIKAGWFPLVVRDRDRVDYLDALKAADEGDLQPLTQFFGKVQRSAFVRVLSIAEDVRKEHRVSEAIAATRRQYEWRRDARIEDWETAKRTAETLHTQAAKRLGEVAAELKSAMTDVLPRSSFFADSAKDRGKRDHYFRKQIIQAARKLDYYANTTTYRAWVRMVLKNSNRTEMLVAFHGIGHDVRGLLACSASLFQRLETDDGEREIGPVVLLADNTFLISYKESTADAEKRFHGWLEDAIVQCINLWQETAR